MIEDIERVLLSEEQIRDIVSRLGRQISEDYKGRKLLMVSVLKGSVVFMADLMRAITIPCEIDFMSVSSYGSGTESSGEVKIIKDLDRPIEGYDLLIVEDILDSGKTLHYISEMLRARRPASIKICTFLDKPERRMIKDLRFPTSSLSATVSITMRSTAMCLSSACSAVRSTRNKSGQKKTSTVTGGFDV